MKPFSQGLPGSIWAFEEGYLDANALRRMKLPHLPQTLPRPLSEGENQLVLAASLEGTRERLRNYSILVLFLDTGIRLSELVNLKQLQIDFTMGEMTIFGKGGKERIVPIGRQAKKALIDYLTRERPDPSNPTNEDQVYLSADGDPITQTAVGKMFQRLKKRDRRAEIPPPYLPAHLQRALPDPWRRRVQPVENLRSFDSRDDP